MVKSSYQDELDHFFKSIFGFEVVKRVVSKAALAKARMKLKYEAFINLNMRLTSYFYENFKPEQRHEFNLLAIDGTPVRLPRIEAISIHFEAWNPRQGDKRASQMFDPLNKISEDAILESKSVGERELALFHFLNLMPNDLVLLDRGYPAYWLFNLILARGAGFVLASSAKDGKWYAGSIIQAKKKLYLCPHLQALSNLVKRWDWISYP
jgi:hypothetical protein